MKPEEVNSSAQNFVQSFFASKSEDISKITEALCKAHLDMSVAHKDSTAGGSGFSYKYANLTAIYNATNKALSDHGLSIVQLEIPDSTCIRLRTMLTHTSGQWFAAETSLSNDLIVKMNPKNPMHGRGSIITYLRRYAWLSICGIPQDDEDDDDANGGNKGQPNQFYDQRYYQSNTYQKPPQSTTQNTTQNKITSEQVQQLTYYLNGLYGGDKKLFLEEISGLLGRKNVSCRNLTLSEANRIIKELDFYEQKQRQTPMSDEQDDSTPVKQTGTDDEVKEDA